jgi:DeoR/GlpR family transcriptional regulator of sugar metabolism
MPSRAGIVEFSYRENLNRNAEQKRAIAQVVARAVQPGMTVLLDTGSTTLDVARAIAGVPRLTILTTSLMIAAALHTQENIELILLGGTVRRDSPDLSGPLTEENLARFRVNLAVLGADGVSPDGAFTDSMTVARVSRAIIKAAERAVLTIDGSKFGRAALVRYAEWREFGQVVTDTGVPRSVRKWLNRKGPEVVYA